MRISENWPLLFALLQCAIVVFQLYHWETAFPAPKIARLEDEISRLNALIIDLESEIEILQLENKTTEDEPSPPPAIPVIKPASIVSFLEELEDPVKLAERFVLEPPTPREVPYNLLSDASRRYFSQEGQDRVVDRVLRHRVEGFFVEAGAYNGEDLSNTLFLEKYRNWTGLLVEANPREFRDMWRKNRHAWLARCCLSWTGKVETLSFLVDGMCGGVKSPDQSKQGEQDQRAGANPYVYWTNATCFPLAVLLDAIGRVSHVDYLSLDIEGNELAVLRGLPWSRLVVDVVGIEKNGQSEEIEKFLEDKGYQVVSSGTDLIYVRRELLHDGIFFAEDSSSD